MDAIRTEKQAIYLRLKELNKMEKEAKRKAIEDRQKNNPKSYEAVADRLQRTGYQITVEDIEAMWRHSVHNNLVPPYWRALFVAASEGVLQRAR